MKLIKPTLYLIFIFLCFSCTNQSEEYEKKGDLSLSNEDYKSAIRNYLIALEFDMSSKTILHSLGRSYENIQNYDSAIYYYDAAIQRDKSYALAYRSRGFCYYNMEEYNNSLNDYIQSLILEPNNKTAISNLGAVYKALGDYKNAISLYYQIINHNPEHYGIMGDLANIYFDLELYDSCFYWAYKTIGNLKYGKDAPHGTLGLAFSAIDEFDSAIFHLNKAIEYNPDWSHYYNNRGYAYTMNNQVNLALSDLNRAIEMDSLNPNFFLNRADAYYWEKNYNNAISDYTKAIELFWLHQELNPGICYNNRAHAKLQKGDTIGYEQDLLESRKLGFPETYQPFSNLSSSYYKKKAIANIR